MSSIFLSVPVSLASRGLLGPCVVAGPAADATSRGAGIWCIGHLLRKRLYPAFIAILLVMAAVSGSLSTWIFPNVVLREATAHAVLAIKALRAMLDDMPRAAPIMLASATGKAWKKRYFSDQSKEASDRAGVIDLHFDDLRGTAITMLAEAGCTIPEIAAITGHSLKTVNTILEKYLSRTRAVAEAAMEKFENAPTTNFASRVQSEVVKTD